MAALLYYITDRHALATDEAAGRARLLQKVSEAAAAGLDYVQLRERDLGGRDLERVAGEVMQRLAGSRTRLLINSRLDVALAVSAHGVHLRADDISPADARHACERAGHRDMLIAVSCHTLKEVMRAAREGADLTVFGPVFGKPGAIPAGLQALREAVAAAGKMPVLALGGVTLENAAECLHAGAAGLAAIRLFQENAIPDVAARVLSLTE